MSNDRRKKRLKQQRPAMAAFLWFGLWSWVFGLVFGLSMFSKLTSGSSQAKQRPKTKDQRPKTKDRFFIKNVNFNRKHLTRHPRTRSRRDHAPARYGRNVSRYLSSRNQEGAGASRTHGHQSLFRIVHANPHLFRDRSQTTFRRRNQHQRFHFQREQGRDSARHGAQSGSDVA